MICDPDGPDMVRIYADRTIYAERTAAILARRCAESNPIHAAIAAMQRTGIR